VQVGLDNQTSTKCNAQLQFRLDGILCSFSKSSQQPIFTQQQPGLDGTPIPHLHKAVVVGRQLNEHPTNINNQWNLEF
jgi:hypothetical protein